MSMKINANALKHWLQWNGRVLLFLGFAAGVVVLLLWLAGKFSPKVPADGGSAERRSVAADARTFQVRELRQPRFESAVGSVQAVHEATVRSRLMARVVSISADLKAGQSVKEGDILLQLDKSALEAKVKQARSAVVEAEALRAQAESDVKDYAPLLKTKAISRQTYDTAVTALRAIEAKLEGAKEAVKAAEDELSYTTVAAPMNAIIIDKRVNVGDTVTPGQVLVTLYNPRRMQLVASVRESLAHELKEGQEIGVKIEKLNKVCTGTISEVVPEAQTASRSFQVKVTGPCPPGIYSGMFGRVLIPLDEERIVVVPRAAVRTVGQLELVEAVEKNVATRRAIRTGRRLGDVRIGDVLVPDAVEVLSGLRVGEKVVLPPATDAPQEAAHG